MGKYTGFQVFMRHALKYGFSLWGINKTGVTISYVAGDDGDYQKGYPRQGPRFTDNGDGTITDNATGLMWAKDGDGVLCYNGLTMPRNSAIGYTEGKVFAGYSDWRVGNVAELRSIIDYGRSSPAIDPIFINTKSDGYWTSTSNVANPAYGLYVHFLNGMHTFGNIDTPRYTRAVRGGQ